MKKVSSFLFGLFFMCCLGPYSANAETINLWYPPSWKSKQAHSLYIAQSLSKTSGHKIIPKVARSYPELLEDFSSNTKNIVYVGSFVQALIKARGIGTPLVQTLNGRDFYSGIMIYPLGGEPEAILRDFPEQITYAKGSSSGESSAKAATNGKAMRGIASHRAAADLVAFGKKKAAFVKNWWWQSNKENYPMLSEYNVPGVSIAKHADNVLTASKSIPDSILPDIINAAIISKDAFGASSVVVFDESKLNFSLDMMKKAGIDPLTYSWK
jgi:ABC-type phosphate/phosphonate transport system substrate-binding protein